MYHTEIKPDRSCVVENINKTIEAIYKSRYFDMSDWTCCAAAHAVMACTGQSSLRLTVNEINDTATKLLGLTKEEAFKLFEGGRRKTEVIAALISLRDAQSL